MKKVVLALLIIVAMSLYLLIYNNKFAISDNTLQENLEVFINWASKITNNVEIKQSVEIDNKKYVLFIRDDDSMSFAKLTKGFNNKYRIDSVETYDSFFRGYIYGTNKAKYLIIYGRNDKSISYAKTSIKDKEYKINIPNQEYYIVYTKVPDKIEIFLPHIKLYDANDVEIIYY